MPRPLPKKWAYTGDVDLRHGGTFYDLSDPTGIAAVSVTDLDSAIGYEGAYMIETGTIYLPDLENGPDRVLFKSMLQTCGYALTDANEIELGDGARVTLDTREGLTLACDAYVAYRGLEDTSPETVVIGKEPADSFRNWEHTVRLRGNAKLRCYVRDRYLR